MYDEPAFICLFYAPLLMLIGAGWHFLVIPLQISRH
jgi:hypothetical protein